MTLSRLKAIDAIELGGIVSVRDGLIERQEKGERVFRLESGDPSFDIPLHVHGAMDEARRRGRTHYTAGTGILPLRQAICGKLYSNNGIEAYPEDVFVTNGAMHALYVVFQALLQPGSEVIVPNPTWTETRDTISLAGGVPVLVELDSDCRYTAENISKYIRPATRAIVINSPHNPTGTVLTESELKDICNVAEDAGLFIISDEAYEHIVYDDCQHISPGYLSQQRNTISIYSFSKSYAMSGLRLGYVVVPSEHTKLKERLAKLLRCTINGVNSVAQYGGLSALQGPQDHIAEMLYEYKIRRSALYEALLESPLFEPVKPQGAFYCWCKISDGWKGSDWDLTNRLIETIGVGSAPGRVFGKPDGYLRFAFSCSTDQVIGASKRLRKFDG